MRVNRTGRLRVAVLVTATLVGTMPLGCEPIWAQSANPADQGVPGAGQPQPGGGSRHQGDHGNRHARAAAAASPRLTELRPQVDPWPRLDAGATICRSLPDLQQLAKLQRDRDDVPSVHPSCSIVTAMVPISIVSRVGPGATEVHIDGSQAEVAWTNAWLPDRAIVRAQPAGDLAPGRHEGQK